MATLASAVCVALGLLFAVVLGFLHGRQYRTPWVMQLRLRKAILRSVVFACGFAAAWLMASRLTELSWARHPLAALFYVSIGFPLVVWEIREMRSGHLRKMAQLRDNFVELQEDYPEVG